MNAKRKCAPGLRCLIRCSWKSSTETHKHAGHAGAREGGGHYVVRIVSAQFAGKNTVARHRMIYSAMGELMKREIHALTIQALAPNEI